MDDLRLPACYRCAEPLSVENDPIQTRIVFSHRGWSCGVSHHYLRADSPGVAAREFMERNHNAVATELCAEIKKLWGEKYPTGDG